MEDFIVIGSSRLESELVIVDEFNAVCENAAKDFFIRKYLSKLPKIEFVIKGKLMQKNDDKH